MLDPDRGYDLIGDIHGCAHVLERLLDQMGYRRHNGVWRHPQRMALFLGDLIDRGPHIRESLHCVHAMVEQGQALCLMGNHEFNALGWHMPAPPGARKSFVREHTARYQQVIETTLAQFESYPDEWKAFLGWLQELPLFIDAGRFRLVHACWDAALIEVIREHYPEGRVDAAFIEQSAFAGSLANRACSRLLNGVSLSLPHGMALTGQDGFTRTKFRTKFWEENPETYGDIVFQPDGLPDEVACERLSDDEKARLLCYGVDEPLLFVGHYWRTGYPAPIRPNLACLDYSAVNEGKLVAYRLDDETRLDPQKFVWVDVLPSGGVA
ncbi:calcineurin-like phosphoesterase family protein [Pseudomonas duriflava]|uniref:Calcineurin-like phosphoesterase family protein n=1 Tax=Pseudomonas duriflava TaxID=459528 RepID=A0A562Q8T3_9PSED|nr:metallophosphoesterase [Pseudomonas duriflava]TWI53104.1 calcineurin-like phosphoesterase family protein [Pseudomonas duriflava]